MKKLGYLCMIVLAAFSFQSCNSENKDSTETADSLNEVTDSAANANGVTAVAEDDAEFSTQAAAGGMAEVELGKLALEKSTNAQVKEFATMMVSDHGKANEELKMIAANKNIALPTTLDEKHQKMWDDLNTKTGKDFDKAYVNDMVDGHQKTWDLMDKQAKDGTDAELKAFATKTAPVVKAHLDLIKKIRDDIK